MSSSFNPQDNKRTAHNERVTDNSAIVGEQSQYSVARQTSHASMSTTAPRSLVGYNHLTYLLYIVSYLTAGLLWIVPIVMNYAKRHDADGTWLATHFDWQIKTFWYSIIWFVVGLVIIVFALGGLGVSSFMAEGNHIAVGSVLFAAFGGLIIIFTVIWHFYRIARGWIALTDGRPVP